ncbi:MAG: helix-turn-helix domain-containing protein [Rickettsiaceae bacterium]|nr:helix-turn-helix domain-containing protein [Rickettsiaceae bacterium]
MTEDNAKVDPIDIYVGKRLKSRRLMLGFSQQDLGEAVSVSIQQVQKYERATNRISSSKLYHFAKFLKVPVSYFFANDLEPLSVPGFAEEQTPYDSGASTNDDNASEREIMSLVRSYNSIKDPQVRKKILDLVRTFADSHTH